MWSSIIKYMVSTTVGYLPYRNDSTAVLSTRTSSKASTRRSERDNASKQAELAGASMYVVEHLCSSLCSRNEPRDKFCPAYHSYTTIVTIHKSASGVMREEFAFTVLFLSVLSISSVRAASGLFS